MRVSSLITTQALYGRLKSGGLCRQCEKRFNSSSRIIAEGDHVLLRFLRDETKAPIFTKPLRRDRSIVGQYGRINHEALIGRTPRDIVISSTGREFRVHVPTLEDYVKLTPRSVTPIYPADANLLVSLLDIHASPPQALAEDEKLHILEAGTGHGALTLYLARAVHASNPVLPQKVLESLQFDMRVKLEQSSQNQKVKRTSEGEEGIDDSLSSTPSEGALSTETAVEQWKSQRGAVIHTLDVSATHSHLARKTLYGFRRGIYAGDVDFHIGDLSDWIDQRLQGKRDDDQELSAVTPFLSHIVLDLPGSYLHIEKAASALHTDGKLIVFNPSLTQIASCVELIRKQKLPLSLDNVVETGPSYTGGRDWDVRAVRPRALLKAEMDRSMSVSIKDNETSLDSEETAAITQEDNAEIQKQEEEQARVPDDHQTGWEMVCRPKVGYRMIAGGFLGVWTKMKHRQS